MEPEAHLEVAHVLFMDVVGYSKLLLEEQRETLAELKAIVRSTRQFRSAEAHNQIVCLPTGDGMVLAFFSTPDAPVRCAIEVAQALQSKPELRLRMGIHSGPVNRIADVNETPNIAGAGINMAQRVMDCGDAGHILVSQRVAEDLAESREWKDSLHDLGECEVKHGVKLHLFNFCGDGFGNSTIPAKIAAVPAPKVIRRSRAGIVAIIGMLLLVSIGLGWWWWQRTSRARESSAGAVAPEKSVAVLPLENLSDDKNDAFFADGILDDILTSLAKVSDLKVISRTSVMQYRGAARNLREIGQALGVANILEGSVRRTGNRVLVNVQLIDALHDRHLWAERYDRTLQDSIGLQGELATEIATVLQAKLAPEEKARLSLKPTENADAYVFYLQARERERLSSSKQDALAVDALYGEAIARDPQFAIAYARAAAFNSFMFQVGHDPERKQKARALLDGAIKLAPDLAETRFAQGAYLYRVERNYPEALTALTKVIEMSPNDTDVLELAGLTYRRQGRWRDALSAFDRAQELDPRHAHPLTAHTRMLLRDWTAAAEKARHNVELETTRGDQWALLARIELYRSQKVEPAGAIVDKLPEAARHHPQIIQLRWELAMLARNFTAAEKLAPDFPADEFPAREPKNAYLAYVACAKGDRTTARLLLEPLVAQYQSAANNTANYGDTPAMLAHLYVSVGRCDDALHEHQRALSISQQWNDALETRFAYGDLALIHALCGHSNEAIAVLQREITQPGSGAAINQADLRLNWGWDRLRSDPRFQKLINGPEPQTIY